MLLDPMPLDQPLAIPPLVFIPHPNLSHPESDEALLGTWHLFLTLHPSHLLCLSCHFLMASGPQETFSDTGLCTFLCPMDYLLWQFSQYVKTRTCLRSMAAQLESLGILVERKKKR